MRLVASCEYARFEIGRNPYDLVVIDVDERDASAKTALAGLSQRFPDLPLIVFPPDNNPHHELVQGLAFKAWLRKPFYLPDLLAAAEAVLAGRQWKPEEGIAGPPEYAWLRAELASGGGLAALLRAECLAAVFFTFGGSVAARTEGLPAEAAEEIAGLASRLWRQGKGREVAHVIRRGSSGAQALLYVTRPEKALLAALILAADTSAAHARSVAAQIKESLRLAHRAASRAADPLEEPTGEVLDSAVPGAPADDFEGLDARLRELLETAPSPDPFRINARGGRLNVQEIRLDELEDLGPSWGKPARSAGAAEKERTARSEVEPAAHSPPPGTGEAAGETPAVPAAKIEVNLQDKRQVFTCVLIPRLPEQSLTGALGELLRDWAAAMCAQTGWKTVDLTIAGAILQWTLEAPAAESPGALVRAIRQNSSLEIYARIPELISPSEEGDFWAPGFLIVRGAQPPSQDQVREFIRQTRLRQGLLPG